VTTCGPKRFLTEEVGKSSHSPRFHRRVRLRSGLSVSPSAPRSGRNQPPSATDTTRSLTTVSHPSGWRACRTAPARCGLLRHAPPTVKTTTGRIGPCTGTPRPRPTPPGPRPSALAGPWSTRTAVSGTTPSTATASSPAAQQPAAPHRHGNPLRRHPGPDAHPGPTRPDRPQRHRRTPARAHPQPRPGLPSPTKNVNDVPRHLCRCPETSHGGGGRESNPPDPDPGSHRF
jgi:hypothetical protein